MKVRVSDTELAGALSRVGSPGDDPESGLVFAARTALSGWSLAEDELAEAFELSRAAALGNAPVVFLAQSAALRGRTSPLDAAVATGLLGGARSLAFERRKYDGFATVIAIGEGVEPHIIADAVELLVATRGSNGQVFTLGSDHLGAALP